MKRIVIICTLVSAIIAGPVIAKESFNSTVEAVWKKLPTSASQCSDYDYFPDGGMQNFWCHVSKDLSLQFLEQATGQKIYLSGPHAAALKLDDKAEFGHYNPKFVEALSTLVIPSKEDTTFITQTQSVYESHVRPLARIHFITLQKLRNNPECAQKEMQQYKANIKKPEAAQEEWYNERWFYFMNAKFCTTAKVDTLFDDGFDGGHNGNVVKTATGFWLRRSMDETQSSFATALETLLQTYDAEWLSQQKRR